jgi:hypothetical protein
MHPIHLLPVTLATIMLLGIPCLVSAAPGRPEIRQKVFFDKHVPTNPSSPLVKRSPMRLPWHRSDSDKDAENKWKRENSVILNLCRKYTKVDWDILKMSKMMAGFTLKESECDSSDSCEKLSQAIPGKVAKMKAKFAVEGKEWKAGKKLTEESKKCVEIVEDAGIQLNNLINGLLENFKSTGIISPSKYFYMNGTKGLPVTS